MSHAEEKQVMMSRDKRKQRPKSYQGQQRRLGWGGGGGREDSDGGPASCAGEGTAGHAEERGSRLGHNMMISFSVQAAEGHDRVFPATRA